MPLLADEISKFFTVVVIAVVWGIGAIASAVKKANEEAARQQARKPMTPRPVPPARQVANTFDRFVGNVPIGRGRPAATSIAITRQAQALAQMTNRARPPAQPQRRVIPAPPPLRQPAAPAVRKAAAPPQRPAPTVEQAPRANRTGPSASVAAPAIRRWLRPGVLRRQFILTELLQPPVALREDRD